MSNTRVHRRATVPSRLVPAVCAFAALCGCGGPSVESTGAAEGVPATFSEVVWEDISGADGDAILVVASNAPHLCMLARSSQSVHNQQVLVAVGAWQPRAGGRASLTITPPWSGPLASDSAQAEYRLTDDTCRPRIQRDATGGNMSLRGTGSNTIAGTIDVGLPDGSLFSVKFDDAQRCGLDSQAIRFAGLFPVCT